MWAELTLCRVPLESPKKAMLWPSRTLTATAVRRAAECSHTAFVSSGVRLAIGLGVWSEPQGYAFTVFCAGGGNHNRDAGQLFKQCYTKKVKNYYLFVQM